MADLIMDLSSVDRRSSDSFAGNVLPDGWYRMIIESGKTDYVSCSGGHRFKAEISVCTPGWDKRKVFESLVVDHTNAETVEIAQAALKDLAEACELDDPDHFTNTGLLEGVYFYARLYSRNEPNEKYADSQGLRQEIGAYLSCDEFDASDSQEAVHPSYNGSGSPVQQARAESPGDGDNDPQADGEQPPTPDDDIPF